MFGEYRYTTFNHLDLTFGGRVDAVENGPSFETWRATVAYRFDLTGTKLRASAGTGAKVPTLYQRFSAYGHARMLPETSTGLRRRNRPENLRRPRRPCRRAISIPD